MTIYLNNQTNSQYEYEAGLMCGRFQHIQDLHENLISQGLRKCKKFLVLVGSTQIGATVPPTARNPFPAFLRINLIKEIFKEAVAEGRLIVQGIPDYSYESDNCVEWGRYLLNWAEEYLGQKLDYMIFGNDESREGWFAEEDIVNVTMDVVHRVEGSISATQMRYWIKQGNFQNWAGHANPRIHKYFGILCTYLHLEERIRANWGE